MHVLAIDQGTTSTKALMIDPHGRIVGISPKFKIDALYPRPGCVEFEPHAMLRSIKLSAQAALDSAGLNWCDIAALGLANQGETVIAFDSETGEPVCPAISWQDRRGDQYIERWRRDDGGQRVIALTGLRLDAYFSAPKLAWIIEHIPRAKQLLATGKLRYGTSDAWLIWQLTGGRAFVSDCSTASRTMLLDLTKLDWSEELAERLQIPFECLPNVVPSCGLFGLTSAEDFGAEIPITGLCVDQQAALFGHQAFEPGQIKITYGTGCFVLGNIGGDAERRVSGINTSVGWRIGDDTVYVLEGGALSGGSLIDWLCKMQLAVNPEDVFRIARDARVDSPILLVPAFSGMGAPVWSDRARGCWLGMDLSVDRRDLAKSALEAIAFSVAHIVEAMGCANFAATRVRADGGLSRSPDLMQLQADVLNAPIECSALAECTALGVGHLAGLGCGLWKSLRELPPIEASTTVYEPRSDCHDAISIKYDKWKRACDKVVEMGSSGLF